jgi:hypothetical protein
MDFSVEVMLPPRGAADFSESANIRYRVLAPVAVYVPRKVTAVVAMPRTGYLHVAGFPDNHNSFRQVNRERRQRRLNEVLCEFWEEPSLIEIEERFRLVERRTWRADPALLPPLIRNALLIARQAEITWSQCKALYQHQVRQAGLRDEDI